MQLLVAVAVASVAAVSPYAADVADAQFLSDATGLINRLEIPAGDQAFEVVVTANFDIANYAFDAAERKLTLQTGPGLSKSVAEVVVPVGLLSGDFELRIDGVPHNVTARPTDTITLLVLRFEGGAGAGAGNGHAIEIIGTETSVPVSATSGSSGGAALPVAPGLQPGGGAAGGGYDGMQDAGNGNGAVGGGGGDDDDDDGDIGGGGGGCLIATAAYGSESSHWVQHLRNIRDVKVASTESGRVFLDGFHAVYYMFSPHVADYQRENPAFNGAVRLLLAPMLLSLGIMWHAEEGSEAQVLAYGSAVLALNLGMYAAAPALAVSAAISKVNLFIRN